MSLLSVKNSHPRDSRIRFEDEGHKYFIDGVHGEYISTTTLVHSLFNKFDADLIIKKMRKSRNWDQSKYNGMTDIEIKDTWEENRNNAAQLGTDMHQNLENFYNGLEHESTSREFELFSNFKRDFPELEAYRTEWVVFDEESKICGSIDLILKDNHGNYIICDFKRSKEIKFHNPWQKGCTFFSSFLDDCNFNHYSLQLGIYKAILEKNYGIKISNTFLLVLHPDQDNYMKIDTCDVKNEVDGLISSRVNGIQIDD